MLDMNILKIGDIVVVAHGNAQSHYSTAEVCRVADHIIHVKPSMGPIRIFIRATGIEHGNQSNRLISTGQMERAQKMQAARLLIRGCIRELAGGRIDDNLSMQLRQLAEQVDRYMVVYNAD